MILRYPVPLDIKQQTRPLVSLMIDRGLTAPTIMTQQVVFLYGSRGQRCARAHYPSMDALRTVADIQQQTAATQGLAFSWTVTHIAQIDHYDHKEVALRVKRPMVVRAQ
jgi:hypothetical protein